MDLGAGRRNRDDVLDLGVGIRVQAQLGQDVAKGDLLFQVHARAGQLVMPDLYLSTLQWTTNPVASIPWLMASIGC
jgi:hypothetical protein